VLIQNESFKIITNKKRENPHFIIWHSRPPQLKCQ
jgi:hypothetical protein